ncbi:hypothetical protein HYC85_000284 [Camellia sinensis]|uniref:Uncharacterized protein n=1 Tax=Camellia sinensis TaxID=4442 RepID=A0A7J7I2V0_CAMSI|nr:hypothetical protein HYC85_000284 [Camellia sinensis]
MALNEALFVDIDEATDDEDFNILPERFKEPQKMEFLCALTLPVGKLVVNYVEQNHKKSKDSYVLSFLEVAKEYRPSPGTYRPVSVTQAATGRYSPVRTVSGSRFINSLAASQLPSIAALCSGT